MTLSFGTDRVELVYPGPAHSRDNIVAYFPRHRILFGGCMIQAGDSVGNRSDADMAKWPSSVRKLRAMKAAWVIPGHGERFDPGLIEHTLEVLAEDARQSTQR